MKILKRLFIAIGFFPAIILSCFELVFYVVRWIIKGTEIPEVPIIFGWFLDLFIE